MSVICPYTKPLYLAVKEDGSVCLRAATLCRPYVEWTYQTLLSRQTIPGIGEAEAEKAKMAAIATIMDTDFMVG